MGNGELVYKVYRVLSYGISPLIRLHLRWRKFRGLEHPFRWRERFGQPSIIRPTSSKLVWFHAVSLGEGLAAIPLIYKCTSVSDITVLMTTTTASAFEVIKERLPTNVIYQFAPLDIPVVIDNFLSYWKPDTVILMESELWPNLVMGAATIGATLVLLNGRISAKSLRRWSRPLVFPLIRLMLSKFSLILPLSTLQGIHFQLLQAPPFIINYCGDLKFAIDGFHISEGDNRSLEEFQAHLYGRKVWIASSIHHREEELFVGAHKLLKQKHPDILTIIVPRKPHHGRKLALKLQKEGVSVALRSNGDTITTGTNMYVVDSLGELRNFYRLAPIAVIGGSFILGSAGHNISEAAAAGCTVFTGPHIGHFSHMVLQMQRVNPLSVMQIPGEKLNVTLGELFDNDVIVEARCAASKQAYHSLSSDIVENIWAALHIHIFNRV